MKIVESWLREWVDPDLDSNALEHQLTMLGLEVDGVDTEGAGLDGVVVAEVLQVGKHPDADRLSVCKVSAGALGIDTVDFEPQHGQLMLERRRIEIGIDPLTQPGFCNLHRTYLNCRRKRRSFSKNVRKSVTP